MEKKNEIFNAKPTPYKTRIRNWGGNITKKEQINFAKDNEYYTPKRIVKYFGEFDYDPATTKEKAEEFGIKNYDTIETNGLTTDWSKYKKIWLNPPFTEKHLFIKKTYETFKENPYIYIYIVSNRIPNNKKISRYS